MKQPKSNRNLVGQELFVMMDLGDFDKWIDDIGLVVPRLYNQVVVHVQCYCMH